MDHLRTTGWNRKYPKQQLHPPYKINSLCRRIQSRVLYRLSYVPPPHSVGMLHRTKAVASNITIGTMSLSTTTLQLCIFELPSSRLVEWVERPSSVLVDRGIWTEVFESWSSQTTPLNIDTSHSLTRHLVRDRARASWLSVRIMWLRGKWGHAYGDLNSQLGSTIKSSWFCTVISRYPSSYDLRCCQDAKLQQHYNSSTLASGSTSRDRHWIIIEL